MVLRPLSTVFFIFLLFLSPRRSGAAVRAGRQKGAEEADVLHERGREEPPQEDRHDAQGQGVQGELHSLPLACRRQGQAHQPRRPGQSEKDL